MKKTTLKLILLTLLIYFFGIFIGFSVCKTIEKRNNLESCIEQMDAISGATEYLTQGGKK